MKLIWIRMQFVQTNTMSLHRPSNAYQMNGTTKMNLMMYSASCGITKKEMKTGSANTFILLIKLNSRVHRAKTWWVNRKTPEAKNETMLLQKREIINVQNHSSCTNEPWLWYYTTYKPSCIYSLHNYLDPHIKNAPF